MGTGERGLGRDRIIRAITMEGESGEGGLGRESVSSCVCENRV